MLSDCRIYSYSRLFCLLKYLLYFDKVYFYYWGLSILSNLRSQIFFFFIEDKLLITVNTSWPDEFCPRLYIHPVF